METTAAVPVEELSDDAKATLVKQVEFYFSDENLPTDAFMKKKVKAGGAQGRYVCFRVGGVVC